MFNFGWGELVLIGIVALIAIGPKELPTVLRTIGQALGKVRRMANEFQGQFQEALREADVADLKKHADDMTSSFNETVTDFTKYDPLSETQKDLEKGLDLDSLGDTKPADTTTAEISADAAPAELPPPADQTAAAAPLPDAPAAVSGKDTVTAEDPPAKKSPKRKSTKAEGSA